MSPARVGVFMALPWGVRSDVPAGRRYIMYRAHRRAAGCWLCGAEGGLRSVAREDASAPMQDFGGFALRCLLLENAPGVHLPGGHNWVLRRRGGAV
jgi:hypothetical protein